MPVREGLEPGHRAGGDDGAAVPLLNEMGDGDLERVPHAGQHHVDAHLEHGRLVLLLGTGEDDPGVGEDDVDVPEGLDPGVEGRPHL